MKRLGLALVAVCALAVGTSQGQEKNPVVVLETSMGNIKVELFQEKAPGTVANFLQYVDDKFYDGTLFHRAIKGFMIQGGGFDQKLTLKPTRGKIKNEAANGLKNTRGTIAMARTDAADSATAQFYINVVDNPMLDRGSPQDAIGYCVFGKVIDGMDIVDKICGVKTSKKLAIMKKDLAEMQDVPSTDVVIKSVKRADKK
jgi:cyclophilin family peptidyl-prolyl cis-trans isomerase